jgi:hypothetical protein
MRVKNGAESNPMKALWNHRLSFATFDKRKPKEKNTMSREYFLERLAEPELLNEAVLLDVKANEEPLAVPVSGSRKGGDIEFLDKSEAKKALNLLKGRKGFPNVRIASGPVVWWGDTPPFGGCDYGEPICALLLGVYYGYSTEAIAKHFEYYLQRQRRIRDRKSILKIIKAARNFYD